MEKELEAKQLKAEQDELLRKQKEDEENRKLREQREKLEGERLLEKQKLEEEKKKKLDEEMKLNQKLQKYKNEMKKLGIDLEEVKENELRLFKKIQPLLEEGNYALAALKIKNKDEEKDSFIKIDEEILDYALKANEDIPEEIKEIIKDNKKEVLIDLEDIEDQSAEEVNKIIFQKALQNLDIRKVPINTLDKL